MTDAPKPPKRAPRFDRRRREYRAYQANFRRLVERRGGVDNMPPEQVLLADQIAEAAALRKGVWAEHFTEAGTMTAERATSLRQQWQDAAHAMRHGISTLRELDPLPGGTEAGIAELERARQRAVAGAEADRARREAAPVSPSPALLLPGPDSQQ